jgi:hypothetical protein
LDALTAIAEVWDAGHWAVLNAVSGLVHGPNPQVGGGLPLEVPGQTGWEELHG